MKYLIDTNVISEMSKPKPNNNVLKWIAIVPETDLYLSVISIGEIVFGINKLADKIRKEKLSAWLDSVINTGFEERILEINIDVMRVWGDMYAKLTRSLPLQDTFIAATALANNLAIATRNTKDFKDIAGLSVYNPWDS